MLKYIRRYWSYFFLIVLFVVFVRQFNSFFEKKINYSSDLIKQFHTKNFETVCRYFQEKPSYIVNHKTPYDNYKEALIVLEFTHKRVFVNYTRKHFYNNLSNCSLLVKMIRFSDNTHANLKYWYRNSNIEKNFYLNYKLVYILGIIFVFLFIFISLFEKISYEKKIKDINSIMRKFLKGDFSARFHVKESDDLNFALSSFNYLIEKLRQRIFEINSKTVELKKINSEKTFLLEKINNFNLELHIQIKEAVKKYQETNVELEKKIIELRNLEILNENIFSSIASGVLTIDKRGNILFYNSEALKVFNIDLKKDIRNRNFFEIFKEYTEFIYYFRRILKDEMEVIKDICIEIKVLDKYIGMNLSLLKNYKGEIEGCVGIFNDITQNILLREQVNRSKVLSSLGQIAAGVAHEVRNPLGAIKGFVELIEEDVIGTRNEKFINKILIEIENINEIVSAILDYSRLKLPNFQENINLCKLIDKSIEILGNKLNNINLKIAGNGKKIYHRVDPLQIQQIFTNIINNAVDAMEKEKNLTISIEEYEKYIEVKFEDSGIGIKKEDIEKIFIPFYTTKQFGTGLGLSIVSRIIENHNGTISVESSKDKGTSFIITFNKEYYRF